MSFARQYNRFPCLLLLVLLLLAPLSNSKAVTDLGAFCLKLLDQPIRDLYSVDAGTTSIEAFQQAYCKKNIQTATDHIDAGGSYAGFGASFERTTHRTRREDICVDTDLAISTEQWVVVIAEVLGANAASVLGRCIDGLATPLTGLFLKADLIDDNKQILIEIRWNPDVATSQRIQINSVAVTGATCQFESINTTASLGQNENLHEACLVDEDSRGVIIIINAGNRSKTLVVPLEHPILSRVIGPNCTETYIAEGVQYCRHCEIQGGPERSIRGGHEGARNSCVGMEPGKQAVVRLTGAVGAVNPEAYYIPGQGYRFNLWVGVVASSGAEDRSFGPLQVSNPAVAKQTQWLPTSAQQALPVASDGIVKGRVLVGACSVDTQAAGGQPCSLTFDKLVIEVVN